MRSLAVTLFGLLAIVAPVPAAEEPAWREPGQIVDRNYRAMVFSWKLRPALKLESVRLEMLPQDVAIGLMGVSIMNPAK
jgi:hypothetical protein